MSRSLREKWRPMWSAASPVRSPTPSRAAWTVLSQGCSSCTHDQARFRSRLGNFKNFWAKRAVDCSRRPQAHHMNICTRPTQIMWLLLVNIYTMSQPCVARFYAAKRVTSCMPRLPAGSCPAARLTSASAASPPGRSGPPRRDGCAHRRMASCSPALGCCTCTVAHSPPSRSRTLCALPYAPAAPMPPPGHPAKRLATVNKVTKHM